MANLLIVVQFLFPYRQTKIMRKEISKTMENSQLGLESRRKTEFCIVICDNKSKMKQTKTKLK